MNLQLTKCLETVYYNIIYIYNFFFQLKESIYKFNRLFTNELDVRMDPPLNDLDFEFEVGMFLSCSEKTVFLIEDEEKELCGFIAAVPDNSKYINHVTEKWLPDIKSKYNEAAVSARPLEQRSEDWKLATSSHFVMKLAPKVYHECVLKRVINTVLSVLKTSGATTVYHKVNPEISFDLFVELGFFPVQSTSNEPNLFWRSL